MKTTGHVFYEVQQLYRVAEIAVARHRGISLHAGMDEFAVQDRMARCMFHQFADLFRGVVTNGDDDRWR